MLNFSERATELALVATANHNTKRSICANRRGRNESKVNFFKDDPHMSEARNIRLSVLKDLRATIQLDLVSNVSIAYLSTLLRHNIQASPLYYWHHAFVILSAIPVTTARLYFRWFPEVLRCISWVFTIFDAQDHALQCVL